MVSAVDCAKVALDNHLYVEGWQLKPELQAIAFDRFPGYCVLMRCDGVPVGVGTWSPTALMFFVHPDHRRKGFATQMANQLLELGREESWACFGIGHNDEAVAFFEAISLDYDDTRIPYETPELN